MPIMIVLVRVVKEVFKTSTVDIPFLNYNASIWHLDFAIYYTGDLPKFNISSKQNFVVYGPFNLTMRFKTLCFHEFLFWVSFAITGHSNHYLNSFSIFSTA